MCVIYRAQSIAKMDQVLFKNWLFKDFVPAVKNFENLKNTKDRKVILFTDNCKSHPNKEELNSGNFSGAFLPPNVASLLQPKDQGVIKNLSITTDATLYKFYGHWITM